ncbi:unnamed protein product [Ranitomeya imitator]|uniref:Uncharacterized protein n=1 Tax=Ranitomeya imitator TaxID=111125 RepID=A0ABN9KXV0_9NEOB|nr:unnamed protein product [Ranitomeya imitator]
MKPKNETFCTPKRHFDPFTNKEFARRTWNTILTCFTEIIHTRGQTLNVHIYTCILNHPELLHYIKQARIRMSSGQELYFEDNGDPPAVYDIVNWQLGPEDTIKHIKVGSYDTTRSSDQIFQISSSVIQWPSGYQKVGRIKKYKRFTPENKPLSLMATCL